MKKATVTIPATSANLGPGFDCLGLALSLHNTVTAVATPNDSLSIKVSGVDAHKLPTDTSNLVYQAMRVLWDHVGQRPFGVRIHQHNQIPVGSGLGSSSTAVLAGLLAANALLDQPLPQTAILDLAVKMEGHPDNVAPALYGGLVLGIEHDTGIHIERIEIAPLTAVVVLPDFQLLTSEARAALPTVISRHDAIFNASRVALLIQALTSGNHDKLPLAMQDSLHQPYRLSLIPGAFKGVTAAYSSGARGVALSGAGPSLIALAAPHPAQTALAIMTAFADAGLSSRHWVLTVDTQGTQVIIE